MTEQQIKQSALSILRMRQPAFIPVSYTHLDVYKRQASYYVENSQHRFNMAKKRTINLMISEDADTRLRALSAELKLAMGAIIEQAILQWRPDTATPIELSLIHI